MSDWEIVGKRRTSTGVMEIVMSGGLISPGWEYTIRHVESGEEKTVTAQNEHDLGDTISEGDFDD